MRIAILMALALTACAYDPQQLSYSMDQVESECAAQNFTYAHDLVHCWNVKQRFVWMKYAMKYMTYYNQLADERTTLVKKLDRNEINKDQFNDELRQFSSDLGSRLRQQVAADAEAQQENAQVVAGLVNAFVAGTLAYATVKYPPTPPPSQHSMSCRTYKMGFDVDTDCDSN
jgi:hypothetical protein